MAALVFLWSTVGVIPTLHFSCKIPLSDASQKYQQKSYQQVAFQDCEDSKVTTNLQKVRQEKNETHANRKNKKKKKNKASQTAPPERVPFFGRLLQTGPPPLIRMDLSVSFGNADSQQVEKKTDGSEAGSQRRTLNPVNLGVAQQVAGELAGELYIIYTPFGSCQNTGSQWIKVSIGLISIKSNR